MLIAAVPPPINPPELHHPTSPMPRRCRCTSSARPHSNGGWLQKRRETRAATLVSFDVRPGETGRHRGRIWIGQAPWRAACIPAD